jgi:sugar fermentation stimulation protein A
VKSATLSRIEGLAEFPDSVTKRGAKHLRELTAMVELGHRAVLFYLIQRTDCTSLAVAADIDPVYADTFAQARAAGVEVIAYDTVITPEQITMGRPVPLGVLASGSLG